MTKKLRKVIFIACGILSAIILLYLLYRDYRPEIDVLMHPDSHTCLLYTSDAADE